jgi:hypothetical protein
MISYLIFLDQMKIYSSQKVRWRLCGKLNREQSDDDIRNIIDVLQSFKQQTLPGFHIHGPSG